MEHSRVTIFAGHYGSGKTNLAVNYSMMLKQEHPAARVVLADLDIVNPYFRSVDSRKKLNGLGIEVIASPYANSNLELPAMPGEVLSIFDDTACYAVIDVGGDDRGAYAIGKYADYLRKDDAGVLLVCNQYRPLSRDPQQIVHIKNEIEAAAHIHFTAVVNNSNLGARTAPNDILASAGYISAVSKLTGLPVIFTAAMSGLAAALSAVPDLFPIRIYGKEEWKIE